MTASLQDLSQLPPLDEYGRQWPYPTGQLKGILPMSSLHSMLRSAQIGQLDLEQRLEVIMQVRQLSSTYATAQLDVPPWLVTLTRSLEITIKQARDDQIRARVAAARMRIDKLKTADEQRAEAMAELTRLEAMLPKDAE